MTITQRLHTQESQLAHYGSQQPIPILHTKGNQTKNRPTQIALRPLPNTSPIPGQERAEITIGDARDLLATYESRRTVGRCLEVAGIAISISGGGGAALFFGAPALPIIFWAGCTTVGVLGGSIVFVLATVEYTKYMYYTLPKAIAQVVYEPSIAAVAGVVFGAATAAGGALGFGGSYMQSFYEKKIEKLTGQFPKLKAPKPAAVVGLRNARQRPAL